MRFCYYLVSGLLFCLLSSCAKPENLKISIFCDHIESIAQQQNISFEEAAGKVRNIGYAGVDIWINQDEDQIRILRKLGFSIPCAIFVVDFFKGPQSDAVKEAEYFVLQHGIERVLLVPGLGGECEYPDVMERVSSFVSDLSDHGVKVMVEDFDHFESPTCGTSGLIKTFDEVPALYHNFDSGNYLFCGEDCMNSLDLFRERIVHVHLKDRISENDMSCPAVGTGVIPITSVVRSLVGGGYDGWFTIECFGVQDMLSAVTVSYQNVRGAIQGEK